MEKHGKDKIKISRYGKEYSCMEIIFLKQGDSSFIHFHELISNMKWYFHIGIFQNRLAPYQKRITFILQDIILLRLLNMNSYYPTRSRN